jgi:hypothetical protein
MRDEKPFSKDIWTTQETEEFSMSLSEIHDQAEKIRGRIQGRNKRELISSIFVLVVFGFYVVTLPGLLVKIGSALVMVGVLVMLWQLERRTAPPSDMGSDCVAYYREELIRQRKALLSVGVWYLAPFVPGLAVALYGMYIQSPPLRPYVLLTAGLCVAVFALIWGLNHWAAARLQRKIDRLG